MCLLALLLGHGATAEKRALLIGVSRVDGLPHALQLQGPDNDVALMRQSLLRRGFASSRIIILAEAAPGSIGRPTRRAIDEAVAALQRQVRNGDAVLLYFAGHGAQVPQRADAAWPEPDGLEEVYLTADVQRWQPSPGHLPNAVLDDEIGGWIDGLVDRGATVWAVFDTCHAAGMSRGSHPTPGRRSVAAAHLGIPDPVHRPNGLPDSARSPPRSDGRVLMFAARAHEATGEERLPAANGRQLFGVFTHALSRALAEGVSNLDQLRDSLRRQYRQAGRQSPVPVLQGDGSAVLP